MAYFLDAWLGPESTIRGRIKPLKKARVVLLGSGMALIPMTDELFSELGRDKRPAIEGFSMLSGAVSAWATQASDRATVAYIRAGSPGGQSAVVWKDRKIVLGPMHTPDAINQALRFLGIAAAPPRDEFDTLGLGRHRETDAWLKDALPSGS